MADASNVRHDTIVVPERMSPAQVRARAERKAHAHVGDDDLVAFVHLHGSRPVGGEYGTEVEWRYSYQVIPPAAQLPIRPVNWSAGASVLSMLLSRLTAEYGEIEYGELPAAYYPLPQRIST